MVAASAVLNLPIIVSCVSFICILFVEALVSTGGGVHCFSTLVAVATLSIVNVSFLLFLWLKLYRTHFAKVRNAFSSCIGRAILVFANLVICTMDGKLIALAALKVLTLHIVDLSVNLL